MSHYALGMSSQYIVVSLGGGLTNRNVSMAGLKADIINLVLWRTRLNNLGCQLSVVEKGVGYII